MADFGYFPDIDLLLPGDLLLFMAAKPKWVSRRIQAAQRKGGYPNPHARWHHAAVHIGKGHIVEAVAEGRVSYRQMYHYIGSHCIRVRRDPSLSNDDRYGLAIEALTTLRARYSIGAIPKILAHTIKGLWRTDIHDRSMRPVICSQVYADAYMTTTNRLVVPRTPGYVIPAALSETPVLQDVPIPWKSIHLP
ncbi:MAG: hypothetical protein HQL41_13315 [Alphaproteobacteria bacterium]|nr:hypothetical protein [Alphaproteobacteria bacterium]